MRKSTIFIASCALWIIGSTTSLTTSQAATITVFHGSKTEIFDMAKKPAGGVHVVKPISTQASTPSPVAANRATRPGVSGRHATMVGRSLPETPGPALDKSRSAIAIGKVRPPHQRAITKDPEFVRPITVSHGPVLTQFISAKNVDETPPCKFVARRIRRDGASAPWYGLAN